MGHLASLKHHSSAQISCLKLAQELQVMQYTEMAFWVIISSIVFDIYDNDQADLPNTSAPEAVFMHADIAKRSQGACLSLFSHSQIYPRLQLWVFACAPWMWIKPNVGRKLWFRIWRQECTQTAQTENKLKEWLQTASLLWAGLGFVTVFSMKCQSRFRSARDPLMRSPNQMRFVVWVLKCWKQY